MKNMELMILTSIQTLLIKNTPQFFSQCIKDGFKVGIANHDAFWDIS